MILLVYMFFGAIIGMLIIGKRIGRYSLLTGGILALLPEIDRLIGFALPSLTALTFTNGFTHSLIIILISSPGIALLLYKIYFSKSIPLKKWVLLTFWTMISNSLIDIFTIKGVTLFYPIYSKSYSLGSLSNTDYFLLFPLIAGVIILFFVSYKHIVSLIVSLFLILFVGAYLSFTVVNKVSITSKFERVLFDNRMSFTKIDVFPAEGSNFNWNLLARNSDGYWESSTNTYSKDSIIVEFVERNEFYLIDFDNFPEIQELKQYTRFWYNVFPGNENEVFFVDIRYAKNSNGNYNEEYKLYVSDNLSFKLERVEND